MNEHPFRIATRGSKLALWQANHVAELLKPLLALRAGALRAGALRAGGLRTVDLVIIHTTGDQVRDQSLSTIGGQGVFTKEIQEAVLERRAELAVHSLKDLPTEVVPGLVLAAVPSRAPTGDAFVSVKHDRFDALPPGARIATGSARRRAQILHRRPDLELVDIRGNVDTRLRKLQGQELDGLILAVAGLERLGLSNQITEVLDEEWMLPAVGQGALGLECRVDDTATLTVVRQLNHLPSMQAVLAERAFLHSLGGGCQLPIGALGRMIGDKLNLRGVVCSPDGHDRLYGQLDGAPQDGAAIGQQLGERLLQQGGARAVDMIAFLAEPRYVAR